MTSGVYKRLSIIDSIMSKIEKDKDSKCWNFTGSVTIRGYGKISRKRKTIPVHRYIYWYYNIKPKGTSWKEFKKNCNDLAVCHRCDNPSCCNPRHLFLGTPKDNIQDCKNKGRLVIPDNKGENHGNHKLTEKQVLKIYRMEGKQRDIANKFGVSFSAVSCIKLGRSWSELTKHKKK